MKLWVGITDQSWFEQLSAISPDEVNFWQPSGSRGFKALQPGEPFLFKLHSPNNFIVGGGLFVRNSPLPISLAWNAFEQKNGVFSLEQLRARVHWYRGGDTNSLDPVIGCNVLAEPFFLKRVNWVPVPKSWKAPTQQGKTYDTETTEGAQLWQSVQAAAGFTNRIAEPANNDERARYGREYLTRGRLGQGGFRVLVTDAYQRRCAITGEKTLPVLEAAHIKPYAEAGPHRIDNGILLRSDLHRLFDLGYVTVTPELRVEVSSRLKEEWENGREYYAHHGKGLRVQPGDVAARPGRDFLVWHNEARFKA
jgi:putative restriction endonuclease